MFTIKWSISKIIHIIMMMMFLYIVVTAFHHVADSNDRNPPKDKSKGIKTKSTI